jgi:LmbE family N-acetylglucosaminyl deacetylase
MNGLLVISPHLDDAVLGCGQWLAGHPGAVVATVFAGLPREPTQSTDWDRRCGFGSAAQALATRREEDRQALAELGAEPLWLSHVDDQYGEPADPAALASSLHKLLAARAPDCVLFPLGLFHRDHQRVHDAMRQALALWPVAETWAYEDALYRRHAGLLQDRLCELQQSGVTATPVAGSDTLPGEPKRRAVAAYASQLLGFGERGLADAARPERFWALSLSRVLGDGR